MLKRTFLRRLDSLLQNAEREANKICVRAVLRSCRVEYRR